MIELAMGLEIDINDRPYNEIVWFLEKKKEIEEQKQQQSQQVM